MNLQAMKQGHGDIARIYAQNAVRKQNEKLNLLQLSSRVDAVAGRVQTAVTMRQITGNMMKVNRSLDVAMKSMSPERVRTLRNGETSRGRRIGICADMLCRLHLSWSTSRSSLRTSTPRPKSTKTSLPQRPL
jgi:hypothetical protein